MLQTSVLPGGKFRVGVHDPAYSVTNLREHDCILRLGSQADGTKIDNHANFPGGNVDVSNGRRIYEIINPLPFRGCTFIDTGWADARVNNLDSIGIEPKAPCSLSAVLAEHISAEQIRQVMAKLPKPVIYGLAGNSTDPEELILLADHCCRLEYDDSNQPTGLQYIQVEGNLRADIDDFELFETLANNPFLPDQYKEAMVLRPGVQGTSPIVGDFCEQQTEVFEYLRSNSYIPWGHYAANFSHNSIRYHTRELSLLDMQGLRHLYYQRMYTNLAGQLGHTRQVHRRRLTPEELEDLRLRVCKELAEGAPGDHPATLWGWNFGYDFSGSGYRLHASHQMIHQQYALVPGKVVDNQGGISQAFSSGDLVAEVVERYQRQHQADFFYDYLQAIRENIRIDGRSGERGLIVWQDDQAMLFVPKAQVSQWELQLMVTADAGGVPVGNVIEADTATRLSIDTGILKAQQIYAELGASMVSSIEYSKRLALYNGQRLLYSFLPKLPWSMGAFSEAQQRFICGHYPEDFAIACRKRLK